MIICVYSMYTFPFNTCEKPKSGLIAQPYSVFFNLVSCAIVVYFLTKTKSIWPALLLLSILLFEMFHTFSHAVHIKGNGQIIITHLLAYLVNLCYFLALYKYSDVLPSALFLFYLGGVILFDVYAFKHLPFIFYLSSQFLIFISLFLYYFKYFSAEMKARIPLIFSLTGVILLLFINETYNCAKMLEKFSFPFHILIEITAIFIVYNISSLFSKLN